MNKLFHGKNTYISLREAQKELKEEKYKKSERVNIDGDKISPEEFIDIINANSLFSTDRIIFLKRLYRNKKKDSLLSVLLEYLEKENPNTTILIWEDQKIRSTTKYFKHFQKNKTVIESPDLNKRTFLTWAQEEVNETGVDLNKNLIRLLSERTNYDPETFSNELQKLKLSGKKSFEETDIIDSSTDNLEYDIWKLIDSINSDKDYKERMEIFERILSQELDANYIISMLARNLRLITQLKELSENNSSTREMASILSIPPFTIPQMLSTAKRYSFEKISLLYEKLSSLDYEIKRGRIDPQLGLTLLITKF